MSYSSVGNLRTVTTTSGQCIQKAAFDQQPWSAGVTQTYLSREKATGEKGRNDNASLKLCGHLHPIFNCWFAVWKKEIKTTAAMVPLLHLALPLHVYTATQLTRDTAEPTYQVCTTPVEPYLRKGQMIPKKKQGWGGQKRFGVEQPHSWRDCSVWSTHAGAPRKNEKQQQREAALRWPQPPVLPVAPLRAPRVTSGDSTELRRGLWSEGEEWGGSGVWGEAQPAKGGAVFSLNVQTFGILFSKPKSLIKYLCELAIN